MREKKAAPITLENAKIKEIRGRLTHLKHLGYAFLILKYAGYTFLLLAALGLISLILRITAHDPQMDVDTFLAGIVGILMVVGFGILLIYLGRRRQIATALERKQWQVVLDLYSKDERLRNAATEVLVQTEDRWAIEQLIQAYLSGTGPTKRMASSALMRARDKVTDLLIGDLKKSAHIRADYEFRSSLGKEESKMIPISIGDRMRLLGEFADSGAIGFLMHVVVDPLSSLSDMAGNAVKSVANHDGDDINREWIDIVDSVLYLKNARQIDEANRNKLADFRNPSGLHWIIRCLFRIAKESGSHMTANQALNALEFLLERQAKRICESDLRACASFSDRIEEVVELSSDLYERRRKHRVYDASRVRSIAGEEMKNRGLPI